MEIYTLVLGCCATNTYVIIEGKNAIIIDPSDNAEYISDFVESKHAKITHVLITHGHFDHIGAAWQLQKKGAHVYMSNADYKLIEFGEPNSVFGAPFEHFNLDVAVNDGDILELLSHKFQVISTCGHTPGSVCFVMDDKTIFTGDTLFRLSVGRTDFPYGNYEDLRKSVKKLIALPNDYKILSGHGEATTLDFERKNNPYAI